MRDAVTHRCAPEEPQLTDPRRIPRGLDRYVGFLQSKRDAFASTAAAFQLVLRWFFPAKISR